MIIYSADKKTFLNDQLRGSLISDLDDMLAKHYRKVSPAEHISWQNSLQYMYMVVQDRDIPDDCGVAIEYMIPSSSKRIDFIITGYDADAVETAVIIELKQWSKADAVHGLDSIVKTFVGKGERLVAHPSYQAWSYAMLLSDFNSSVQDGNINLYPCSYLHNYREQQIPQLKDPIYRELLDKSPLFEQRDSIALQNYIKKHIRKGDQKKVLYSIENGRIRPAKSLQDKLVSMLQGNTEFIMVDDQKSVYEQAIYQAEQSLHDGKKRVMIIEGGPGTGKSVVSINLLVELIRKGLNCQYVSKNSAPRAVYKTKLKGNMTMNSIDNLFKGSGSYYEGISNEFDALIVDEAHRLNEKSGFMSNRGENQIKEIIGSSRFSIFFIDEDQMVTLKDIGRVSEIYRHASFYDADITIDKLESQFRCNGSDGYLAWLDDVLEIRETANKFLDVDYDFDVLDTPNEVLEWVKQKNTKNKARMMAGYCWEWPTGNRSKKDYHDIIIENHNFKASWNLDEGIWAIGDESVNEIGCIHTSQGLEFDYIGVIVGLDLKYENNKIITVPEKRASSDRSLFGLKKMMREDPEKTKERADRIIKNTYRTLMTRGMKGCRIYCCDQALASYIKSRLNSDTMYVSDFDSTLLRVAEDNVDYSDQ